MLNLLKKISITAVYHLTQGSQDLIAVQERLEKTKQALNILNEVDLLAIKHVSDSNKLLMFRLNYKETIDWVYALPQLEFDEEYETESVVEWLIGGEVETARDVVQLSLVDIKKIELLVNLT